MAKSYITKKNIFYRFQQLIILILHLILLNWMVYALTESGALSFNEVMLHFFGMSVYGGALIRGCAYWAKYHHLKSQPQHS
jgi:hypothetical protein